MSDVPVPAYLYTRFPTYRFTVTTPPMPEPWSEYRRTLIIHYSDWEATEIHPSKQLLIDSGVLKNKSLEDYLAKRIERAVALAQAGSKL